jgi:hypothetical protein
MKNQASYPTFKRAFESESVYFFKNSQKTIIQYFQSSFSIAVCISQTHLYHRGEVPAIQYFLEFALVACASCDDVNFGMVQNRRLKKLIQVYRQRKDTEGLGVIENKHKFMLKFHFLKSKLHLAI